MQNHQDRPSSKRRYLTAFTIGSLSVCTFLFLYKCTTSVAPEQGTSTTYKCRVVDEAHRAPLADVEVNVKYANKGTKTTKGTTDTNGSFRLEIEPGEVQLKLSKVGYITYSSRFKVSATGTFEETIVLKRDRGPLTVEKKTESNPINKDKIEPKPSTVQYRVFDGNNGEPLAGVNVKYKKNGQDLRGMTDKNGGFQDVFEAGTVHFVFFKKNYFEQSDTLNIDNNEVYNKNIKFVPISSINNQIDNSDSNHNIRCRVVDTVYQTKGIGGVSVRYKTQGGVKKLGPGLTNEEGWINGDVEDNSVELILSKDTYVPNPYKLAVSIVGNYTQPQTLLLTNNENENEAYYIKASTIAINDAKKKRLPDIEIWKQAEQSGLQPYGLGHLAQRLAKTDDPILKRDPLFNAYRQLSERKNLATATRYFTALEKNMNNAVKNGAGKDLPQEIKVDIVKKVVTKKSWSPNQGRVFVKNIKANWKCDEITTLRNSLSPQIKSTLKGINDESCKTDQIKTVPLKPRVYPITPTTPPAAKRISK